MAPGYRNSNRRPNRTGYVDHDVFEGLPVRHWRRDYVTVAPPPMQESTTSQNDTWAIELPHGMPKDSHLLPQHSQELLRAARSGRIYKRPLPVEEEEVDPEAILGDKPEKKEEDPRDKGFTAKAWKQIPRHMEGPDIEYLAKRRKGLITIASKAVSTGPTLTKTTVRRTDAAGNEYVQDVIIPKGQQVEGEVIAQTIVPDPAAADGFAHPTPPKRKGVPPKNKKIKGPGRGRKKKAAAPTSVPEIAQGDGLSQTTEGAGRPTGQDGIKVENANENDGALPSTNEDTEMGEGSIAASDDEGGEDGEEGDEGDDEEGSISAQDSPAKPSRNLSPLPSDLPHMREISNPCSDDADMSSGTALPGPPLPKLEISGIKSGSPLKNVAMATSNLTSPIKSPETINALVSEASPPHRPSYVQDAIEATSIEAMQEQVEEMAPPAIPLPLHEPTEAEINSAIQLRHEEEEEEEMLLDILENTNNANIGAPQDLVAQASNISAEPASLAESEPPLQELEFAINEPQAAEILEPNSEQANTVAAVERQVAAIAEEQLNVDDDDNSFTDLLGGLEKQLNEPQAEPQSPPAPAPVPKVMEERVVPQKVAEVEVSGVGDEKVEEIEGVIEDV